MVSYGDDRTGRWLTSESAGLRALVDDVLRPVIDYDEAHGGDLLPTIRTWLEHDRQTDKAAQVAAHPPEHAAVPGPAVRADHRALARVDRGARRDLARSARRGHAAGQLIQALCLCADHKHVRSF